MKSIYEPLLTRELGTLNALELSRLLEYSTEETLSVENHQKLVDAIDFATVLHSKQTRRNRDTYQKTPYIEHPLRNTLRLVRWGVTDISVLIASLLHDTVEDCYDVFCTKYLHHKSANKVLGQFQISQYINDMFGDEVTYIIKDVTNPEFSVENKLAEYQEHVKERIHNNPQTFLVKLSDFVDNACGLYHSTDDVFVTKQIPKYKPVIDIFLVELDNLYKRHLLQLPKQSLNDMEYKLQYTQVEYQNHESL